jgi:hypothetical protein
VDVVVAGLFSRLSRPAPVSDDSMRTTKAATAPDPLDQGLDLLSAVVVAVSGRTDVTERTETVDNDAVARSLGAHVTGT